MLLHGVARLDARRAQRNGGVSFRPSQRVRAKRGPMTGSASAGIHKPCPSMIAPAVVMDSGFRPSAGPGMTPRAANDAQSCRLAYRQPTPARELIPIHHNNALGKIGRPQRLQNLAHACDDCGIAPVAVAEQDQAWVGRLRKRQQPRIVEIGGDDRPAFLFRTPKDFEVGARLRPRSAAWTASWPWFLSDAASSGDSGMSTRNFTGQLVEDSSTVSSSARKAAYRRASSMSPGSRYG